LGDVRPLQHSERQLFHFFRDKGIPLVFVLTKYDKLIRDRLDDLAADDENPTPEERARAKDEAKLFVEKFRGELEAAVERGVKVQEVSNKPKGIKVKARKYILLLTALTTDNALVQKLVAETTAMVKPNLRNAWIRAQGVLATQKREGMDTALIPRLRCNLPAASVRQRVPTHSFQQSSCSMLYSI
jgi:hypothetical protein